MPTLCVIDDEPEIRMELGTWLEECGYKVITSAEPEAYKQIEESQPDLVILDIIMPEIDGLEILSQIKANRKTSHIPVIMLTAKKESATIFKAQELKACDYFMKPFEDTAFLKAIERHLSYV